MRYKRRRQFYIAKCTNKPTGQVLHDCAVLTGLNGFDTVFAEHLFFEQGTKDFQ